MRVRIGHWIAGAFLVGVMVVGGILLIPALQRSLDESEQSIADSDSPVTETQDSSNDSSELDLINEVSTFDDQSFDLLVACPDPAAEHLPETCVRVLDQFFLDWNFGRLSRPVAPSLTWLKFGRIFGDPEKDRKLVLATLEREECFLPYNELEAFWGRNIANRTEQCHSSAFVNYAQFNLICMEFRDGRDSEMKWIHPDVAAYRGKTQFQHFSDTIEESAERNNNDAQFERRKSWLWREVLEARWLKRKCAQFGSVPVMAPVRDTKEYDLLKNLVFRLERSYKEKWESEHYRTNIYEGLIDLASYVGGGFWVKGYRQEGEAWEELVYGRNFDTDLEKYPWRETLDEGRLKPTNGRAMRLNTAWNAVASLEDMEVEFDWYWLVESVCQESEYPGTDEVGNMSCQGVVDLMRNTVGQALDESRHNEDGENYERSVAGWDRYFQFLDKFQNVALELGIYD